MRTLITGGLGFLGSNLAHNLVVRGDDVWILDNSEPGLGADSQNLSGIEGSVRVIDGDVRACLEHAEWFDGVERVFHCAGNGDHGRSMREPLWDLEINTGATLKLLEAVRRWIPHARVLTLGSRAEYGPAAVLPVSEDARERPQGCYAVSKCAATHYAQVYSEAHGLDVVQTRLTNVFGPRAQMRHPGYGVANWFLRQGLYGEPITLYGDGQIRRDYVFVEDAVRILIELAECQQARGQLFNLGGVNVVSLRELATQVLLACGREVNEHSLRFTPYPPGKQAIEPGDFIADTEKLRAVLGEGSYTSLALGLAATVQFYGTRLGLPYNSG